MYGQPRKNYKEVANKGNLKGKKIGNPRFSRSVFRCQEKVKLSDRKKKKLKTRFKVKTR
jgi:hypothetical protein